MGAEEEIGVAAGLEITDDVDEFYANFVQIFSSRWDFLFAFGHSRLAIADGSIQGSQRADVLIRMSPQHAKETHRILGGLVERYEERNGPINFAPSEQGGQDE